MIRAGTGSSTATNPRTAAIEATTAALKQAGRAADCALIFREHGLWRRLSDDRAQRGARRARARSRAAAVSE